MDKKAIAKIVEEIVVKVAAEAGLEEGEARALVGIAIKKSAERIVEAVKIQTAALSNVA